MSEGRSDLAGGARWILPSLGSVLGLVALANALFFRSRYFFASDGDVGRHIRIGRTIIEDRAIPAADLFSHTRQGAHFVPYEWLSELLTALVDAAFGLPGIVVMSALLYAIAVFAVYRIADELGSPRTVAFAVAVLALLLQSIHLLPRPHLFTTAFAALFLLVLVRFAISGKARRLVPLPFLMLIWANSHGGFLIGFILLGFFLVGSLLKSTEFATPRDAVVPLLVTIIACLGASLLNPAGLSLWAHTLGYLRIDFLVDATQEYQSVDFHEGYGKLFFICLFAGPAAWMTGRVRVSPLAAVIFLFFAATALHSTRNIPLFTVAAMPWLSLWITQVFDNRESRANATLSRFNRFESVDRQLKPGLASIVAAAMIWFALAPNAATYQFDPEVFPIKALAAMSPESTESNVFNQMIWGGHLLYEHPEIPVFIDGQTDFYGEELSRDYVMALKGSIGWQSVLDRYEIGWTLLSTGEPLNQLLELDSEWRRIYMDDVGTVYVREATN